MAKLVADAEPGSDEQLGFWRQLLKKPAYRVGYNVEDLVVMIDGITIRPDKVIEIVDAHGNLVQKLRFASDTYFVDAVEVHPGGVRVMSQITESSQQYFRWYNGYLKPQDTKCSGGPSCV